MNRDHSGKYLRPTKRATAPVVVFAVELDALAVAPRSPGAPIVRRWESARVFRTIYRRGQWTAPESAVVSTPEELRAWMDERADAHRTNWVIAESAQAVLTLSGWWSYAERMGIAFERRSADSGEPVCGSPSARTVFVSQLVMSGRCDILTHSHRGVNWRWVGARNYWPDGGAGNTADGAMGGGDERDGRAAASQDSGANGAPTCGVLSRFCALCDWWRRVARAPFGQTAGQLAVGILRSSIPRGTLCTHNNDDRHRLERDGAHGGRASVWFAGEVLPVDDALRAGHHGRDDAIVERVAGPVTTVDVSSAHAWLMRDNLFPTKPRHMYGRLSEDRLAQMLEYSGCIATVRLRTEHGEYPYPHNEVVWYPVGEFTTVLAGPELKRALSEGSVIRVFNCATYDLGRPFAGAMETLLGARKDARDSGDAMGETFCKLLANALPGKLAQREGHWKRHRAGDQLRKWGNFFVKDESSQTMRRFRWLAGAAYEWTDEPSGRGPFVAAFAYLTSYMRQHMRDVRESLPARSVVSQDTDGLAVLPAALRVLTSSGMLAREGPGALRVKASADTARFYGARHYRMGEKWVMSGYKGAIVRPDTLRVSWLQTPPLFGRGDRCAPDHLVSKWVETAFPALAEHGRPQPDGWILPHRIIPTASAEE